MNAGDTLPTVRGSCVYNSANVEEANTVTFTTKAAESENYSLPVLTVTHGASITKATPSYTVPTGLTAKYGQTLANITLPKQLRLRVVTNSTKVAYNICYTQLLLF